MFGFSIIPLIIRYHVIIRYHGGCGTDYVLHDCKVKREQRLINQ